MPSSAGRYKVHRHCHPSTPPAIKPFTTAPLAMLPFDGALAVQAVIQTEHVRQTLVVSQREFDARALLVTLSSHASRAARDVD